MANQNSPDSNPAISAAELRRRLLVSTPPPSAVPEPEPAEPVSAVTSWGNTGDLLSRLRMPGGGGKTPSAISMPGSRAASTPVVVPETEAELPLRQPASRRTPPPGG